MEPPTIASSLGHTSPTHTGPDFTLHHIENTLTAGSSSRLNVRSAFKNLMEDIFLKWKLVAALTIEAVRAYHCHPFSFFHSLLLTKCPPLYTPDEEVL